jgi:hypothetical protein
VVGNVHRNRDLVTKSECRDCAGFRVHPFSVLSGTEFEVSLLLIKIEDVGDGYSALGAWKGVTLNISVPNLGPSYYDRLARNALKGGTYRHLANLLPGIH